MFDQLRVRLDYWPVVVLVEHWTVTLNGNLAETHREKRERKRNAFRFVIVIVLDICQNHMIAI